MPLHHIESKIFETPHLIHPLKLKAILHGLGDRLGVTVGAAPIQFSYAKDDDAPKIAAMAPLGAKAQYNHDGRYHVTANRTGIVTLEGTLINRAGHIGQSSGIIGYDGIVQQLRMATEDPETDRTLLVIDSPGGEANGAFDTASEIRRLSAIKPIDALIDGLGASGGYILPAAARTVYATATSTIGSIGVVMAHRDLSEAAKQQGVTITHIYAGEHKIDGSPWMPLTDAAKERFGAEVADLYRVFVEHVAEMRGLDPQAVINTQAMTYMGEPALGLGLIDAVVSGKSGIGFLDDENLTLTTPRTRTPANQRVTTMDPKTQTVIPQSATDLATPGKVPSYAAGGEVPAVEATDTTAIIAQAKTEERQRIQAILTSEAATGRSKQATHLAFSTEQNAKSAIALLEASAQEPPAQTAQPEATSELGKHMASLGNPTITPAAEAPPAPKAVINSQQIYQNYNRH